MAVTADKLGAWMKVIDAELTGKGQRPGALAQVNCEMQDAWLDALRDEIRSDERRTDPPPGQVETRVSTSQEMEPTYFSLFVDPLIRVPSPK